MKQHQILWIALAVVAAIFINKRYPFATSPLWPWNTAWRKTDEVLQQGAGYGSSDEEGF